MNSRAGRRGTLGLIRGNRLLVAKELPHRGLCWSILGQFTECSNNPNAKYVRADGSVSFALSLYCLHLTPTAPTGKSKQVQSIMPEPSSPRTATPTGPTDQTQPTADTCCALGAQRHGQQAAEARKVCPTHWTAFCVSEKDISSSFVITVCLSDFSVWKKERICLQWEKKDGWSQWRPPTWSQWSSFIWRAAWEYRKVAGPSEWPSLSSW